MTTDTGSHDPLGKMSLPMLEGTLGEAAFAGMDGEHRLWLSRSWSAPEADGDGDFALWCGMNPSTASHLRDDLTVRKDQVYTRQMGLSKMFKVNVGSYRLTPSERLKDVRVDLSHPNNLLTIRELASRAKIIVMVTGRVPQVLEKLALEVFQAMRRDRRQMLCLGLTRHGWPKHSSRTPYSAPIVQFP